MFESVLYESSGFLQMEEMYMLYFVPQIQHSQAHSFIIIPLKMITSLYQKHISIISPFWHCSINP